MLSGIISFSIKNKLIVGLFTLALAGWGIFSLSKLPIDAVPDITENQVQVITVSPSLGAPDIERQITIPVELANRNIPGLKQVRSFSRFGLSLVTLVFTDDTDIYWARQQVSERLISVQSQLPPGIGLPELAPMSTGLGEIYQYVVRPKPGYESKYDAMELRTIQDHLVRKQLLGTPGVADVSSFGGQLKQYEIAIDPAKLAALGLSMNDVFDALEKNNQNTGGAYIERGPTVLFIRSEGLISSEVEIEEIPVALNRDGSPILIRDLAKVKIGFATRYGAMCYNDQGEVAGAVVMMLKGANSSQVIEDVKVKIEEINANLPEGVMVEPFLDRTKMVDNAISTVLKNLLEGALIVIFVLVIFLGNFRAGLIVASVIPLSMLFAISMMHLFGVSGNLMSLGAIDFGLIVDGAVIIVEAVMHKLHQSALIGGDRKISQSEIDKDVKNSAGKMMSSAAFGQIIILMVYLPILTLQGVEGKMFRPMAETVAFALIGALIFSLTYVPMAASVFLSKNLKSKLTLIDRAMMKIQSVYKPALEKALAFPKIIISVSFLLFLGSAFILTRLGGEFIPELEEGDFAIDTRVLAGSNLNTTIASTQKAASILLERFPEVEKVVTKIGSGEIPTDPMPPEASDMMVILKDKSEWTSARSFDELAEKMNTALSEVPGITVGFQFPVQMRFNELMTGARQDVVCKIYGDDLDTLAYYASKLGNLIPTIEGAKDLYVETVTGMPQMVVEMNRPALANYGLSVNDVNRVIKMAFAGERAGYIYEGEKRFDLTVRMENDLRQHPDHVKNLLVRTPSGADIPLSELADVEIKDGPYQIQRENAKRRITVGFNVRGRDVQSVVEELKEKVEKESPMPDGYTVHYGGQFENLNAAKSRLAIAVPLSLLLILLLLYFAFRSLKQGLLIFSAIPLSAIGGVLALVVRGMPFSISAGIGFIALFGVAVLNGIVLIAEFNRLKAEHVTDLKQLVLRGTETRLRPVLMTAAVASLGFLPMALSNGAGAEVQRPLATVVIGGLITSTLLTLLVLPVIYVLAEKLSFKPKVVLSFFVFIALTASVSQAQSIYIGLDEAIDSAEKNNFQIRAGIDFSQAKLLETKTAWDIPQTDLNVQYGQYNSAFSDYNLGISQQIQFPTVYAAKKKVLQGEYKLAEISSEETGNELRRQLRLVFYEYQITLQNEILLNYADSLYTEFLQKAALRLKTGESNLIEKLAAEGQSVQIRQQLMALKLEKYSLELKFRQLMNTSQEVFPRLGEIKIVATGLTQTRIFPGVKHKEQVWMNAKQILKYESSKYAPSITFGYNNTGITGFQNMNGTDVYYGPNSRFSYISAGLSIPLFFGAQAAKIRAAKMMVLSQEKDLMAERQVWQAAGEQAQKSIQTYQGILREYEKVVLPNAEMTVNLAGKQLNAGEISYIEWILLINQSIQSRALYLKQVQGYNESVIELLYLNAK